MNSARANRDGMGRGGGEEAAGNERAMLGFGGNMEDQTRTLGCLLILSQKKRPRADSYMISGCPVNGIGCVM